MTNKQITPADIKKVEIDRVGNAVKRVSYTDKGLYPVEDAKFLASRTQMTRPFCVFRVERDRMVSAGRYMTFEAAHDGAVFLAGENDTTIYGVFVESPRGHRPVRLYAGPSVQDEVAALNTASNALGW